jgi:hypothetical protein
MVVTKKSTVFWDVVISSRIYAAISHKIVVVMFESVYKKLHYALATESNILSNGYLLSGHGPDIQAFIYYLS